MDTRRLRMFCTVARRGSLIAAARDLHLTPSALSHGLKKLETQIGCRLLDRIGKRIYLNQAGEQLLSQVTKPLADLDQAGEEIKRLGKWGQTRLRIGAAASACQYILPAVIKDLKKSFDNVSLQVVSGDIPETVEMLYQNKIDLALGVTPEKKDGLEVRLIFKDELLFTFAPSHPWASVRAIPKNEIPTQPYILYQCLSFTAQLVEEYFREENMVPHTIMEIDNLEAIKELVKLNLGVAILPPWIAAQELRQRTLCMRPMGRRPLHRQWSIISLSGRRLNLMEETFCRLCKKFVYALRMDRYDLPKT